MLNICQCGAGAGYTHGPYCPYPEFSRDEKLVDEWIEASDAKYEKLRKGENHDDNL